MRLSSPPIPTARPRGEFWFGSVRTWSWLGALSVLGLLLYPLPISWAGLGGLAVLAIRRWRDTGRPFPRTPFSLPLGLYLAGAVVGLVLTVRLAAAEVRFFGLLGELGAFLVVYDSAKSARAAHRLSRACLLALLAPMLLAGILLTPILAEAFVMRIGEDRFPLVVRDLLQSWAPSGQRLREAIIRLDGAVLLQRFRPSSAGVAMLAACGYGLAMGPLVAGPDRRARLLGLGSAVFSGSLLALLGTRAALITAVAISLVPGSLVLRSLLGKFGRPALAGIALLSVALVWLAFAAGSMLVGLVPARMLSPETMEWRLDTWGNVLFLSDDFRFTGVGLGVFSARDVYRAYFPAWGVQLEHTHNVFLQSYLEQGLLGLAGILGLVGVGLVVGGRTLARVRDPLNRSAAVSSAGAALALMLTGLTDIVPVTTVGMVLLSGSLALLSAVGRTVAPPTQLDGTGKRANRRAGAYAAGGVALLVAYALVLAMPAGGGPPGARLSAAGATAEWYTNLGALELVRAQLGEGLTDLERRQHGELARSHLDRAQALDPSNPRIYLALAASALSAGDQQLALTQLALAETVIAPDDSRAYFQLGRLYRQADAPGPAVAAWLRVDPALGSWNDGGAAAQLIDWGLELNRAERWPEAVAVTRAAIELAPSDSRPYPALSQALLRAVGSEPAQEVMQALALLHPNIPWAFVEAATLCRLAGRTEEAVVWDRRAEAVTASAEWRVLQMPHEAGSRAR